MESIRRLFFWSHSSPIRFTAAAELPRCATVSLTKNKWYDGEVNFLTYYRKFFGMEVARNKKPESISFAVAKTHLVLQPASGKMPGVDRIAIKVAGNPH